MILVCQKNTGNLKKAKHCTGHSNARYKLIFSINRIKVRYIITLMHNFAINNRYDRMSFIKKSTYQPNSS